MERPRWTRSDMVEVALWVVFTGAAALLMADRSLGHERSISLILVACVACTGALVLRGRRLRPDRARSRPARLARLVGVAVVTIVAVALWAWIVTLALAFGVSGE